MKNFLSAMTLLFATGLSAYAESFNVASPDAKTCVIIDSENGHVSYSVLYDGTLMVEQQRHS